MRELIENALKGHRADYIEIRIEESQSTHIGYRGRELEDIAITSGRGGNVRAAFKGGWGFACFNDLSNLRDKVSQAVQQARMVGKEKTQLVPIETVVAVVPPEVTKDPGRIPLAEKKALTDQYCDALWSVPGIQTSSTSYGDGRKHIYFGNSEGAYIEQESVDVVLHISAVARDGGDVQQTSLSLGSNGDYGSIEGLHKEAEEIARKAVNLLKAPQIQGGEYTVILDPVLAGVFIHEAFGHLSEADHVYEDQRLKDIMLLGKRFGGPHLNVIDGAAIPGLRGSYMYDSEGVPSSHTYLIREGVLVGRLHSRETAAKMGESPTGNARAISYNFPPIVRMTNTFIEPGEASLDDLLAEVKDGIYAANWFGGMTSMEMFTFSSGESYRIRNGRIAETVRSVMLSGNLFSTLHNLDAVANDLSFNQGGGCGKGGQFPLPVSNGSPHIRIRNCLVGGS
ncbi:MAG: TldD/PmbA family protein [Chloroflexi bacterium]|nr:TldD/PmbA family protein [Chloroflexota bacterium]